MKKYICLLFILSIFLCACKIEEYPQQIKEKPVLYYKNIKVVVVSNDKMSWFTNTHWYRQRIKVKSKEYNVEKMFELVESGVFANMPYWKCKEGDIINAELYSWKIKSTGKIVKREINRLN